RGATGCCASECSYRVPPVVELAGFYQGIRHRGRPARRGILGSAESLRGRDTDMTDTAPCYLFLDCDRFYFAVEAAERPGFGPEPPLALRARVLAETGISVSLGLATSPLVAKMASEAAKKRADHLCIVTPGAEASFLSPLPVRALVGVGPKAEAQLRAAGI